MSFHKTKNVTKCLPTWLPVSILCMGWPVRVFQNLIYLNKKVESDLGTLLTTPKSTQNENIRSKCQSSPLLTYRQCRRRWPAARGGGGTRRWPSPRPRGSCRSAQRWKVTQSSIKLQSSRVSLPAWAWSVRPPPRTTRTACCRYPRWPGTGKYFGVQLKIFKCLQLLLGCRGTTWGRTPPACGPPASSQEQHSGFSRLSRIEISMTV